LRLDASTHALESIDSVHHEIHEGNDYLFQEGFALNDAARDYLIETADTAKEPHMTIVVTGAQDTSVVCIEGTDETGTTELTPINRNRRSKNTAETKIYRDVAGAAGTTTQLFSAQWGIPAVGGGKGGGGGETPGTRQEFNLKRNKKYKITITALSANVNNITVSFDWYSHKPKN
jgi:hypothetical protein